MTNLRSIAGAAAWMMVSALLAAAALEPVTVGADSQSANVVVAQACAAGTAACDSAAA